MPWLVGTALVHSLAVTEKRGVFKSWTVLLAIFAFSLSLLGTFLVRSSVLTSVHAFASDPERGYFILVFLAVVIGSSLLLYAVRASHVKSESSFELLSRETFLLVNNILLSVTAMMVLLGTLYPLVIDALGMGKISVGPPYFNALFIPLMSILVLFLAVGAISRWKRTELSLLIKQLALPAVISVVAGVAFPFVYGEGLDLGVAMAMVLAFWVTFSLLRDLRNKTAQRQSVWAGLRKLPRSYYGMQAAHLGVAITVVGIALVSVYTEERDLRMAPGDQVVFRDYTFVFDGTTQVQGPNYRADRGQIQVLKDGQPYTVLHPEKRLYNARGNVMTEAAIDPGLFRDLYVALGEPLEQGAWAVRVQNKPFVRWLWLGGLFMTFGGLLAATDPRYRRKRKAAKAAENMAGPAEAVA